MAGVDEFEIRARRDQQITAGALSEESSAKQDVALEYLKTKGYNHDFAVQMLREKGADVVLTEKAAAEADAAPVTDPVPVADAVSVTETAVAADPDAQS